jgi:5-methylcytosine-specific restriction endonuclease McrA
VFCKSCDELGMFRCPKHGVKDRIDKTNAKVRARLKESERQKIRQAFLAGVRAERMNTTPYCKVCGTDLDLELHHIVKRSQGHGYRDGAFGVDDPTNLVLLCRKHHREAESNPQWSTA